MTTVEGIAEEIREGLLGNYCRCAGYQGILEAVRCGAVRCGAATGATSADG